MKNVPEYIVFVPFLGDLFSIMHNAECLESIASLFSSPFSGTFFQ